MINNIDDNFDDIDLDQLFNDFNENQSSIPRQSLTEYDLNLKINQDDLIEFNENDCTAPRINRKRIKTKKKLKTKQTTMYDYASSISYKHRQYYSSLDNTITTKTITKEKKRSLTDYEQLSSISKKPKIIDYNNLSSQTSPDFIDNLLQYLDERSRNKTKQDTLKNDENQNKKKNNSIL